jgi:hypothetical protein
MSTTPTTASSSTSSQARVQQAQSAADEAASLESEATQDALWRIAQNNAMAKLRGLNKLAKAANDMA